MEEELQPLATLNQDELPRQINGLDGLVLGEDMIRHEDAPMYTIGRTERVIRNTDGHFVYENPIRARAVNQDQEQGAQVDDGIQQVFNESEIIRSLYATGITWGNAERQPYRTRSERMIDVVEEMANLNKINQEAKVELIQKIREIV